MTRAGVVPAYLTVAAALAFFATSACATTSPLWQQAGNDAGHSAASSLTVPLAGRVGLNAQWTWLGVNASASEGLQSYDSLLSGFSVDGAGNIFTVLARGSAVASLSSSGALRWSTSLAPALVKATALVSDGSTIAALCKINSVTSGAYNFSVVAMDAMTGKTRWTSLVFTSDSGGPQDPSISFVASSASNTLILTFNDQNDQDSYSVTVYSIDALTGVLSVVWSFNAPENTSVNVLAAVDADDTLFIELSQSIYPASSSFLAAVPLSSRQVKWNATSSGQMGLLAVYGGSVTTSSVGSSASARGLAVWSAADGTIKVQSPQALCYGAWAVAMSTLVCFDQMSLAQGFDLTTGARKWVAALTGNWPRTAPTPPSNFVIADAAGTVFILQTHTLFVLDGATGRQLFTAAPNVAYPNAIAIGLGGTLLISSSYDGSVTAFLPA